MALVSLCISCRHIFFFFGALREYQDGRNPYIDKYLTDIVGAGGLNAPFTSLAAYRGLNEQNSQKSVIVYNEPCAHIYHFKFKAQSSSLPINVIVALNICRLFLIEGFYNPCTWLSADVMYNKAALSDEYYSVIMDCEVGIKGLHSRDSN